MGSSRTRAQTHVPCIGRRSLNRCAPREVTVSPNFWYVVFLFSFSSIYFLVSLETYPLNHGLFISVLLSFQVFIDFLVISLSLISSIFHCGQRTHLLWFQLSYFLRFVCGPGYSLSWYMCCELLKQMCCWVECSINVDQISLAAGVVDFFCVLADFLFNCSISCWQKDVEVSSSNCGFLYVRFQSYQSSIHVFCSFVIRFLNI